MLQELRLKMRRVRKEDLGEFLRVYTRAYEALPSYHYTDERDVKWYFRWLMKRDPEGFMLAEVGGRPVGFVGCDVEWLSTFEGVKVCEVHELVVDPPWMGRGVGRALMLEAIEHGRSRGRRVCELWVGKGNKRAIGFYRRMGFEERESVGVWLRMIKSIC